MPKDYGSVKRFDGSAEDSGSDDGAHQDDDEDQDNDDEGDDNQDGEGEGEGEEHLTKNARKHRKRVNKKKAAAGHLDENDSESSNSNSKTTQNQDTFTRGPVVHSSQLDSLPEELLKDKRVVVIGSGASAVEAVETALERGSGVCTVLARDDKWIIPRNILFDTAIAAQPFGREMPLSFIWEYFLRKTHYRGVEDLIPPHTPIFGGTPVVNDEFLPHVRSGRCVYVRGDPISLTSDGVKLNERTRESKKGDKGEEVVVDADVVVLATGFEKPTLDFFGGEEGEGGRLFPEGYERPNLYLQNFSTEDWTVLMTNSSYLNAIGEWREFLL